MKQTLPKNEERKRIQLYKEGYNDVQIAKRCGVSKSAIAKWRKRRNLPSNHIQGVRPADDRRTESICWECKNAMKCNWIMKKEKIWDKAIVKTDRKYRQPYLVYSVQKCKHYEKEVQK